MKIYWTPSDLNMLIILYGRSEDVNVEKISQLEKLQQSMIWINGSNIVVFEYLIYLSMNRLVDQNQ